MFNNYFKSKSYVGLPFEANMKWFASKKRSKVIWDILIPSGGVKIFGNISKRSFVGLGGTFGIGFNKKYNIRNPKFQFFQVWNLEFLKKSYPFK
jgi:hypothetical protein